LKKGVCDEKYIDIWIWDEAKPNKPTKSIGPNEEQKMVDICKDCSNFSEKRS